MNLPCFFLVLLTFCTYVWALMYYRWDLAMVAAVGTAAVVFLTGFTPPDIIYFAILAPAAIWFWRDGRPAWRQSRKRALPPVQETVHGSVRCPCLSCRQSPR